eukprot:ctg_2722.g515
MATAAFLEALTGFSVDAVQRARWGQRVEHEFAGVPCGIMDQLISSAAVDGAALLIDCRDVSMTPVVLDDPETEIVVVNSNVKHSLADGEYGRRRAACERAASAMGVPSLRDADLSMLEAARQAGKLATRPTAGGGTAAALVCPFRAAHEREPRVAAHRLRGELHGDRRAGGVGAPGGRRLRQPHHRRRLWRLHGDAGQARLRRRAPAAHRAAVSEAHRQAADVL